MLEKDRIKKCVPYDIFAVTQVSMTATSDFIFSMDTVDCFKTIIELMDKNVKIRICKFGKNRLKPKNLEFTFLGNH